jgi:ABC-type amino acid transport substrate-binding protein
MKARYLVSMVVSLLIAVHGFAAERQVKLVASDWEPYVGSHMPNKGFISTVIIQAFRKAGYDVSIEFHPWDKALQMAAEGNADGIFPAYQEKSREEYLVFSDTIYKSPLGICKRRKVLYPSPGGGIVQPGPHIEFITDPRINQTQALRDLKNYKFGVVSGYVNTPEFDAADFLIKVEAPSDEANIAQLLRDDVHLILIDKYVARNIMIKKFPWFSEEVAFMHPPLSLKELYLAVSKKTPDFEEKMEAFNAGLRILRQDGILDMLMRRYGF